MCKAATIVFAGWAFERVSQPFAQRTMKAGAVLALLLAWLAPLSAIYQDQVGEWDWHQQNVGRPKGVLFEGKSMLVWTDEGVLAAVNVRTGALNWRLVLPTGDAINDVVHASASELLLLTKGGQSLRWVNAETGVLLADVLFADHDSGAGQLLALGQNRVAVVAGSTVAVVSSARRAVDWKWDAEKAGQKAILKSVDKTADGKLVVAGCIGAVDGNTCRAIAFVVLDQSSGKGELKSLNAAATPFNRDAIVVHGSNVYAASAHSAAVTVLDAVTGSTSSKPTTSSVTALHVLSGKPVAKICSDKGCSLVLIDGEPLPTVLDCGSSCDGITVTASSNQQAALATGFVHEKNVVKMWIVSDQSKEVISRQVTLSGSDGRKPADVFVQLFSASNGQTSYRALVVSAGRTWSMFQSDSLLWNRFEALSNIDQVVFVEHVAGELLEMMQVEAATHQIPGFFERLHLQRLRLRQLVFETAATFVNLLAKVVPTLPESLKSLVTTAHENEAAAFGFNKLAICLTKSGALVAMDLMTGTVEWSAEHPQFLAAAGHIRLLATRPAATLGYLPEVMLVTQQGDAVYATLVDALNGNIVSTEAIHKAKGVQLLSVFPAQTFDDNKREVFMFLFSDDAVVTYPKVSVNQEHPLFVHKLNKDQGDLQCLRVESGKDSTQRLQLVASAVFPPSSERIINVVYPRREDISQSNAQILGDDGVLLKYINPHVVGVFSTTEDGEDSTLHVSIVDTVACRVLYRTVHHSAEGPVKGLFIENWLIYSYFNVKAKRTELGVVTLYEGMLGTYDLNPFKRVQSESQFSAFTTPAPIGLQKTYVVPRAVTSLSASTTAFGITTKHVFIGLESGQVMSVPLKLIDPRRPVGEPNKVEKAEGLMQYSPFLPTIPQAVINYYRAVERLNGVYSTPAKLESTSLALATGLDLYFTRVLPSKSFDLLASDFNRPLLVVILTVLTVALLVLRKLEHDKRIKTSWK